MKLSKVAQTLARIAFVKSQHNLEELTDFRIKKCEACEHFKKDTRRCGICWCYMDVKAPAMTHFNAKRNRVEITHCPIGNWGDMPIALMYQAMDQGVGALEHELIESPAQ